MKILRRDDLQRESPGRVGMSRRALLLSGAGLLLTSGAGLAGYATLEAKGLRLTSYRPRPKAWPNGRVLSITVIADLHAGGPNMTLSHIREVIDLANAQGSDLIVLLGDYFATHRFVTEEVAHSEWAGELSRLRARLGIYAILGNHDWWHDITGVRAALQTARIPILENNAVLLGEPGERFWLAGLGDQIAYRLGFRRFRGVDDLPGTLAQIDTNDPVVLLVHEPDIFPKVPERVALTLAGHTHGGQIRLPVVWPSFVPSSYGARFAYGHIIENERHMIVSGGLGTSIIPARLGMPPEILRINLGS